MVEFELLHAGEHGGAAVAVAVLAGEPVGGDAPVRRERQHDVEEPAGLEADPAVANGGVVDDGEVPVVDDGDDHHLLAGAGDAGHATAAESKRRR